MIEVTNEHAFVDLAWLQPSWIVHVDGEAVATARSTRSTLAPGASTAVEHPDSRRSTLDARTTRAPHACRSGRAPISRGRRRATRSRGNRSRSRRRPGVVARTGPHRDTARDVRVAGADDHVVARADRQRDLRAAATPGAGTARAARRRASVDASNDRRRRRGDGATVVTHTVDVPDAFDDIPRVGVRLRLGPGVHTVEWLGRGSARVLLRPPGERAVRAVDDAGRRVARPLRASAGERQPASACAGCASSTKRATRC